MLLITEEVSVIIFRLYNGKWNCFTSFFNPRKSLKRNPRVTQYAEGAPAHLASPQFLYVHVPAELVKGAQVPENALSYQSSGPEEKLNGPNGDCCGTEWVGVKTNQEQAYGVPAKVFYQQLYYYPDNQISNEKPVKEKIEDDFKYDFRTKEHFYDWFPKPFVELSVYSHKNLKNRCKIVLHFGLFVYL